MKNALLILLTAASLCAQSPDPSTLGPLNVDGAGYRIDRVNIRGVPWATDIWGNVFFPRDLAGGPYPLIIMLHGNHGVCRIPGTRLDTFSTVPPPACLPPLTQTENHAGYDYIAGHLASYGYIVASISANAINGRAAGLGERGHLVLEHLRYWNLWNQRAAFPFGTRFVGKIDMNRIGLWGHSRGGEGVRAAYQINRNERRPFAIKAVMELGPIDAGVSNSVNANPQYNVNDVPWSVILPVCDWDVSDNSGMRAFDRAMRIPERANPSAKSQIYLWGANHNFGNMEWEPEDAGFRCTDFPVITTRTEQEGMLKVYSVGFFRQHLGGDSQFRYLFTGDQTPPSNVWVPVQSSYREPANQILLVDDFTRPAAQPNAAGGETAVQNAQLLRCRGQQCQATPPWHWYHDPTLDVARVTWSPGGGGTPAVRMNLGVDGTPKDVSPYSHLAFRAAIAFNPANPNLLASQRLTLRLTDVENKTATTITDTDREAIPYPTGSLFRRSVLQTLRVPLARFPGVDLTKITRVEVLFDQQPSGSVYLSDVHFTR